MKKNVILIIIIMLSIQLIQAEPRNDADLQVLCNNFLAMRNRDAQVTESYELTTEKTTLAVVHNLSDDGFIVTAADDNFYPVIAYSWQGSYDPQENADDLQFRFIRDDLALRLQYYRDFPAAAAINQQHWHDLMNMTRPLRTFQQWPMDGTTSTDGWCKAVWTQSGIFNEMCPLDSNGNRSVVGCVATAMAQIMFFHKYAGDPTFGNSDNYNSGWWEVIHIDSDHEAHDFPDWAELNGYLDDLVDHFDAGEELTNTDLAALNYACGVSVEMSYSADGSGANTSQVGGALRNKFDYDSATWDDNNGNNFYTMIANNQKQMQPCEFSIYTEDWNSGHAIVCDGYNNDNYFHLNYGWGTSNIGWYNLPSGMPSNYTIIGGAVNNIEGGDVPVPVTGIIAGAVALEGCHIVLEGENYTFEAYANENGEFSIDALMSGWYTVSASLDRIWFVEEDFYIDANSDYLVLELFNYEALTGNVTAPVSSAGANLALYDGEELIATGVVDDAGDFSISDILPGVYLLTASLIPSYYGESYVTVTPQNQSAAVEMQFYDSQYEMTWAGEPEDVHTLVPLQITCAIKFNADDLTQSQNNLISGVKFVSPIENWQGTLSAQLWKGGKLLVETPVSSFSYGEEVTCAFPMFEKVDGDDDYFVGFSIYSDTGIIAWHDVGPRVAGKGAWFRITNWVEVNPSYDFNYSITAQIITSDTITDIDQNSIINSAQFTGCYPNPFMLNGSRSIMNISYSLQKDGNVDISCYNLKGQKVAQTFSGYQSAGEHIINWQPQNLSSGLYFYRLFLDDQIEDTQKTIIIK